MLIPVRKISPEELALAKRYLALLNLTVAAYAVGDEREGRRVDQQLAELLLSVSSVTRCAALLVASEMLMIALIAAREGLLHATQN